MRKNEVKQLHQISVEYDLKRSFMFSSAICVRFTGFSFLLVLNQDSFGSGIYPKTSCELNCTSKGFSGNFLDLAVKQSPQGLSVTFLTNALNQSM